MTIEDDLQIQDDDLGPIEDDLQSGRLWNGITISDLPNQMSGVSVGVPMGVSVGVAMGVSVGLPVGMGMGVSVGAAIGVAIGVASTVTCGYAGK